ncbi:tetratricopeptide repeat protein [Microcoleus sp. CAWBG52]|uniref:tetratricopeptide repeat protein n=1 Tax=Microcoleus sp. CAWBG52 TaxID=2841649 RepID=UPI0025FB0CC6|nr:tetratricopeptide repeat protein [Microcoleus sp. CAWBG52]
MQVQKWNDKHQSLGEPSGIFRYQDKLAEITPLLATARNNELQKPSQTRAIGEVLFEILFDDRLLQDFVNFYHLVVQQEKQLLRVELDIDEQGMPEIAALPWEFMCVPGRANLGTIWLGTVTDLVFSRRRSQWIPATPIQLQKDEKLRIALAISAPQDLSPVAYESVQETLEKLAIELADRVELLPIIKSANPETVDAVLAKKPHIFHFIGHGRLVNENNREIGQIAFVDPEFDEAMWVDADYFSELFNQHRPGVVMLQACEGGMLSASQAFVGVASRVVQQNIPVVVAMQYEVTNSTACRFSRRFYQQLVEGYPVDIATQYGRRAIALGPTQYRKRDFAIPVIFMRVPNGYLFSHQNGEVESEKSTDQPISKNNPPIPENLPRSGVVAFVGRDIVMSELHQILQQDHRVAVSAIGGMGGIGKTELALQYALKHLNENTYLGGVCWLQAQQDVATQIVDFAITRLGLKIPDELKLPQQVAWCWQHWQEGLVLIVYDDVLKYKDIETYLPPVDQRFKVLLTTRLDLPSQVQKLSLEVLTEEASLDLFSSIVIDGRIDRELKVAKDICEWLGYLPLGLELAGRYLAFRKDLSLTKLWERLQQQRLKAEALIEAVSGMTAQRGIAAAFELSWEEMLKNSPNAEQVTGLLGLFASAPIPWNLVQNCLSDWNEEDLENVQYKKLLGLHLLQRVSEGTYQLHSLIREFFRTKLEQYDQADKLKRLFATTLATISEQLPYRAHRDAIIAFEPNVPHLKEVANNFIDCLSDRDCCKPLTALGRYYRDQGQYDSALTWLTKRVEICEYRLGAKHPLTAAYYNNLALLYNGEGEYQEAERLLNKALEIYRYPFTESSYDLANSLGSMARVCLNLEKLDEAEKWCKKSLEMKRDLMYPGGGILQTSVQSLADYALYLAIYADILELRDNNNEAIEQYLESLRILDLCEQVLREIHPHKPYVINDLGLLYEKNKRYEEAESLYREALKIRRKILVPKHPELGVSLNNLALLLVVKGKYDEAEKLFLEALYIKKYSLPEEHPSVVLTLINLANLYVCWQKHDEASSYFIIASTFCKNISSEQRLLIATYLFSLATFYCEGQEQYSKAEPLYKQALEIRVGELGENHDDVAVCFNNLAFLYQHLAKYEDAQKCYVKTFNILWQLGDSSKPNAAIALSNLAGLYGQVAGLYGQVELYAEAEKHYSNAVQMLMDCLGHKDPKTLQVWENFNTFLHDVVKRGQTTNLSNSPATQQLIQKIEQASEKERD